MSFFKKRMTERQAAALFVQYNVKEADENWPTLYAKFRDIFKDKFIIENEEMAIFDFALASISQDFPSVSNLFPESQAKRIERHVYEVINTEDWGGYAVAEVKCYVEQFQDELKNIRAGGDPLSVISFRLLHKWLGDNIKNFTGHDMIISPSLVIMTMQCLSVSMGRWKRIKENFKLEEG